jgi:HEAT repeat protein
MRALRSLSFALTACSLIGPLALRVQAAPPAESTAEAPRETISLAAGTSSARVRPATATPARTAPAPRASVEARGQNQNKAESAAATGSPDEHARKLRVALAGLSGSDPVAIQQSLASLKELKGRAAAEGIVERLKVGLPPQLGELALDVLGGLDQPLAVPVLSELTLHRRWQIRAKAVTALGALHMRSSVSVLLYALDDPSPEVRSAAARALGMVGDPRATSALNAALERGVDGALEGLAQLANNKQVDGILARAKSDLKGSEPALWLLLARTNLPVVSKLKVIQFVQAHDSEQEAAQLLALWREKAKSQGDARLASALAPNEKQKANGQATKPQVVRVPAQAELTSGAPPAPQGVKP